MIGEKFNRLTVVEIDTQRTRRVYWKCLCECGKVVSISSCDVKSGHTKSCGCMKAEKWGKCNTTHGMKQSREYSVWRNMKLRCYTETAKGYEHYGGRGIMVCAEWLDSFETFLADMGPCPTKTHSIDRIDQNKGYSKHNCRWATKAEQSRNTRNAVTFDGIPLAQIAEQTGIKYATLYSRLKKYGTPHKEVKS